MSDNDSLLSDLCTICHINSPKYRCPRCSTRTCSLPCSRRHKLWSQCSGVRDPAAYLKRSELATEAAFDRDFNFITRIERSLARADRDAENRGISLDGTVADRAVLGLEHEEVDDADDRSGKRKRSGQAGLVKGEAAFLRGVQNAGVRLIRAPRGMSRNKANASRLHPKHKCLSWTVEWVSVDGERKVMNFLESCVLANAYDRVYPLRKEGEDVQKQGQEHEGNPSERVSEQTPPLTQANPSQPDSVHDKTEIPSHRGVYFYLHCPRTATKQPVLAPLTPGQTLSSALRDRVVLEFPTIYALSRSPETLLAEKETPDFILEEQYLQTRGTEPDRSEARPQDAAEDQGLPGTLDLGEIDEKKVLEVLKKDLLGPGAAHPVMQ